MSEAEFLTNSGSVTIPQNLKYLASNVEFSKGNSLLHEIVLDDSFTNRSVGERCLNAVLLSISGAAVNELNDDGYSALHLVVLKENVLMVRMLLSCVGNIDLNLKSDIYDKDCGKGKNTALHLAANLGNLSIIEELLKKGVDINVENGCGNTPLQLAIESRNLETVKFLIEKGASVDIDDYVRHITFEYAMKFYCTDVFKELLHKVSDCDFLNCHSNIIMRAVACNGNADAVQILVDRGYDVNAITATLDSPLHLAVESGDFKTIECLVINGANVNAVKRNGESVLHIAGKSCDLATFKFLFDKCAHVIKNDPTLLLPAARSGNLEKVDLLLNKNNVDTADVNRVNGYGESVLYKAVKSGNLSVINLLLSKGAELNFGNNNSHVLCFAARSGDLAVVEFLLDQCSFVNVNDNFYGNSPLYYAVRGNHVDVIKTLLDRGCNVNSVDEDNNPALHIAAFHEKIEAAQTLLERGCQVNAKNDWGYTPLILALEEGVMLDSDIANSLRKWGASIDGSPTGNTELHYACLMPNFKPDIFNSLLKGPGDACTTNNRGVTPLHCAAKSNNVDVLRLLVEKGADLNAKDVNGDTPLHYASRRGHTRFVKALLKRRAIVDGKGLHGRTPLLLAAITFADDVVNALMHYGADINMVDNFGKTAHNYEEDPIYDGDEDWLQL